MNPVAPVNPVRFPRAEAIAVAKVVCDALNPYCTRLVVAGSLRRRKPEVKDIEIVYVSKVGAGSSDDFFAAPKEFSQADKVIDELRAKGVLAQRQNANGSVMWGQKNKLARHVASGIGIDLFATSDDAWFNYLVCRTGPAELNTLIATRAQDMGWKWNPYGPGFSKASGESVAMTSERAVFEFVGLPYLEPWERNDLARMGGAAPPPYREDR